MFWIIFWFQTPTGVGDFSWWWPETTSHFQTSRERDRSGSCDTYQGLTEESNEFSTDTDVSFYKYHC